MRTDGTCRTVRHEPACLQQNVKKQVGTIAKKQNAGNRTRPRKAKT